MEKPNYKLVRWGDYSIPVPLWAKWMSIDEDGAVFVHENKPAKMSWLRWEAEDGEYSLIILAGLSIEPPVAGAWTKQLYWIGDK